MATDTELAADAEWISISAPDEPVAAVAESMTDRVRRVDADIRDITEYYRVNVSPARRDVLQRYYAQELIKLSLVKFNSINQQDRADYLLLRNHLQRSAARLQAEWDTVLALGHFMPFADNIVLISEARERVDLVSAQSTAQHLDNVAKLAAQTTLRIKNGNLTTSKVNGYRLVKYAQNLKSALDELGVFYATYDPMFDWWASKPLKDAKAALDDYIQVASSVLAGIGPENGDEIIGEPIGREALLTELRVEMIAYSPDELVDIANNVFSWCEHQMKLASKDLGFGDDWKAALAHVKEQTVEPGKYPHFVRQLAREGADYVEQHNLLTVPPIAKSTSRVTMLDPEKQKVSPFFLGGPGILVAYPTVDMPHDLKQMVMRGNNRYFARATAFHELIPGHKMQEYSMARYNTHRKLFSTPFWTEGWALYWELLLWDRGDFFVSPEDKIGTLFWRMHRCARIIFSLSFHLGQMTPQECVDLLVNKVGHERSTAEAEVRRSFNGEWAPLYQCGYMLGALQLWALRGKVLASGRLTEKQFHDTVLRNGYMSIELVRAVLLDRELTADYKPQWRWYAKKK
ncbi:hypothetical protein VHEMI10332 [[Torrubiella] hemipterigena]|uniref:X-Pro dipeptidyl-peptidase n=1 Tax=[Torrubiella] hemipterigena TaxID=1531966 RepID=A0A0A1TRZ7_9HYPO|nr:hypothetical protein VHEMI10332 [[Torrubiella] hemipterigena]